MPAHLSRMTPARRTLYALVACVTSTTPASACCLTDWLYGRQPAYAVAPAVPVTPGYAAACPTAPYTAGYTPYTAGYAPYTAGYTPVVTAAPNSSVLPLAGSSIYAQPSSVQQPAYAAVPLNNPSVYSDLPITSGYRGAVPAGGAPYGIGNVYPNNYASASPSVITTPATTYQANYGSSVQLPVTTTYAAPPRGGLARFFDSLLGTGYRTSYYSAPVTYYRPATTVDPVTGTTVTIQQSCASTVEQVQRTPYTTFEPAASYAQTPAPGTSYEMTPSGIAPCNATSPCDSSAGTLYGTSSIPSTVLPNGYGSSLGGTTANGDLQPLDPPTLPPPPITSNFSGRLSYPDTDTSDVYANLSPLTGSSSPSIPSYQREVQADLKPLSAPSLQSAKPAYSDQRDSSAAVDDAYRQGYEAGRTATEKESAAKTAPAIPSYGAPENANSDPYGSSRSRDNSEAPRPSTDSHYQLNPPDNSRSSADDASQRTRAEIERDERDLQGLTTGGPSAQGNNRLVYESSDSAPRVRPIPAPDDYHNPFDSSEKLTAPDLLPALPPPSASYYRGAPRTSGHSNQPQRLSVPVREASIQGTGDRMPAYSPREAATGRATEPAPARPTQANSWQSKVRQQSHDSGWYTKGR